MEIVLIERKNTKFLLKVLAVIITIQETNADHNQSKNPVILVHGIAGATLEAKWHLDWTPNILCDKKEDDWEKIWLRIKDIILKETVDCWANKMFLVYDKQKRRCFNRPGVQSRVAGEFGDTKPEEHIGLLHIKKLDYYSEFVNYFVDRGYERGVNLFGACYDWRYAANELAAFGYFSSFKQLVERINQSTGKKVVLVGHSLGGLVVTHFLNHQPQQWKNRHIESFLSIATPWLGAVSALKSVISGSSWGIPTIEEKDMKKVERTFHSIYWLLPEENAYSNTVVVSLGQKHYTGKDYHELFKDIKYPNGYLMRQDVLRYTPPNLSKIGVKHFCVWSNNMKTDTLHKILMKDRSGNSITEIKGEGDGTVPLSSLRHCKHVHSHQFKVHTKEVQGFDHTPMIQDENMISIFYNLVNSKHSGTPSG